MTWKDITPKDFYTFTLFRKKCDKNTGKSDKNTGTLFKKSVTKRQKWQKDKSDKKTKVTKSPINIFLINFY